MRVWLAFSFRKLNAVQCTRSLSLRHTHTHLSKEPGLSEVDGEWPLVVTVGSAVAVPLGMSAVPLSGELILYVCGSKVWRLIKDAMRCGNGQWAVSYTRLSDEWMNEQQQCLPWWCSSSYSISWLEPEKDCVNVEFITRSDANVSVASYSQFASMMLMLTLRSLAKSIGVTRGLCQWDRGW